MWATAPPNTAAQVEVQCRPSGPGWLLLGAEWGWAPWPASSPPPLLDWHVAWWKTPHLPWRRETYHLLGPWASRSEMLRLSPLCPSCSACPGGLGRRGRWGAINTPEPTLQSSGRGGGPPSQTLKWRHTWPPESKFFLKPVDLLGEVKVASHSLWRHGLYSLWNSPGQNTGVGSLSLLQGIFPAPGPNPGLPHCRQILYQLSHKGSLGNPPWRRGASVVWSCAT